MDGAEVAATVFAQLVRAQRAGVQTVSWLTVIVVPTKRFHGFNPKVCNCSWSVDVYVCIY